MKDKVNILIVGAGMYVAGRGTDGHGTILPAIYESYRKEMVGKVVVAATCAKSIQALKRKKKELSQKMGFDIPLEGVPSKDKAQSYKDIIRQQKFDCAMVVVPDHLHYEITSDLIKAGIHVLVVKPLTPTVKEAKKLIQLTQKYKVYGAVEFHKRYDEANLKLRDVVQSRKLGDISYITVEYSQRKIVPEKLFKGWAQQTNIFQYLGVHYADMIYFISGAKPKRVMAIGQKNWLVKKGIDTYDSITIVIEWVSLEKEKMFTSTIHTNWIDPNTTSSMSDQKIKVIGTKGRYDSDQKNRGVQIVTENGIEDFNPYFSQFYGRDGEAVFQGYGKRSVCQFIEDTQKIVSQEKSLKDFSNGRPTFEDALVSTSIVEAANKSLQKSNMWVKV